MASQLELINRSLYLCGVEPVGSLEEASVQARAAKALWDEAYKAALASYRWTFAKTDTSALARLGTDSTDGFPRYQMPSDSLAIVKVVDQTGVELRFRLDGTAIVIVQDQIPTSVFLTRVGMVDVGLLPGYFTKAFSYELAGELAPILTENTTLAQTLQGLAASYMQKARQVDAMSEGTRQLASEDSYALLNVRGG